MKCLQPILYLPEPFLVKKMLRVLTKRFWRLSTRFWFPPTWSILFGFRLVFSPTTTTTTTTSSSSSSSSSSSLKHLSPLNSESNRWFFIPKFPFHLLAATNMCTNLLPLKIYFFLKIIRKIKKIKHDLLKRGEKYEIHPWLNVPLLPPSNGDAKVMILSEGSHCRAIPHKYRMPMMGPKSGKPSKKKHPKQDQTEERHQPSTKNSGPFRSLDIFSSLSKICIE